METKTASHLLFPLNSSQYSDLTQVFFSKKKKTSLCGMYKKGRLNCEKWNAHIDPAHANYTKLGFNFDPRIPERILSSC